MNTLRDKTLAFIERHRLPSRGPGAYRYSLAVEPAALYASCYAAMTLSLYGELGTLPSARKQAWVEYLLRHQDEDGLFRDPLIFAQGWYADDPFWCGRAHLTCHVLTALTCLDAVARKPFALVREFSDLDHLADWLAARDWAGRVATSGNEIMNVGTLLQYARDMHNDAHAGCAVNALLEWLSTHHLNADTGLWGDLDNRDPVKRSHAAQAAYHWWPLFFYDARPVPCIERAMDSVLATQNARGGFGWGVHNPACPLNSSACEDIDSIDPLIRMSRLNEYRRDDVHRALRRAAEWVLTNQAQEGGFVFVKDRAFEYGHPEMRSEAGQGAMFPTWFRTLSLALIGKALPDHALAKVPWQFVRCPGFQFWG